MESWEKEVSSGGLQFPLGDVCRQRKENLETMPFSTEQKVFIVKRFAETSSLSTVRRDRVLGMSYGWTLSTLKTKLAFKRCPETIQDLKIIVEEVAASCCADMVKRATANFRTALMRLKRLKSHHQCQAMRMANNAFIRQMCTHVKKLRYKKLKVKQAKAL